VTLAGESPLEIKDVAFDATSGRLLGFTLRRKGFLGGPVSERLSWQDVHGFGPDAVVIEDESVLVKGGGFEPAGDVTGDRVITESGDDLGRVVEVVVATGTPAEVVGFEIEAAAGSRGSDDHHVFVPLPDTLSISDERVIVPDSAAAFIQDDLSGFGGAVDQFRSQLSERGER